MYMQVCNLFLCLQEWRIFAQKLDMILLLLISLGYFILFCCCCTYFHLFTLSLNVSIRISCDLFRHQYWMVSHVIFVFFGHVCVTVWAHSSVLECWDYFKYELTASIPLIEVIGALKFSGVISYIKVDDKTNVLERNTLSWENFGLYIHHESLKYFTCIIDIQVISVHLSSCIMSINAE
jgi:hypothetical protein